MKTWLIRLSVFAGALASVAVAAAWLALRASLPALDGTLGVEGLSAPASIHRDADGIPVITAANRDDLAFATGFAHGQDRFFQMDSVRRQAAGELSALIGPSVLDIDRRLRFHRFRSRAAAVLRRLPAAHRSLLEHYAVGVNAGLDSLGARPFEYLLLRATPEPWQPEDSVLVVYAMFMQLNDSRARDDVRRGLAHRVLPAEVYAWLYPAGTDWDAPIVGTPNERAPLPAAERFSIREVTETPPPAGEVGKPNLNGSNNWAVGGALTTTGRALVANDMHLGHRVPNIWYQARLRVEGTSDVTGVTLPGTPFVVAGSNGHVAWGYTNSYGDWSDAILLEPGAEPGTYRTPDGDRAFATVVERIEVRGATPVELKIRETIWGPVDTSIDYPDGEIAVRWLAHQPRAVNLELIRLETADSVDAALDIAARAGIPPQNFVVGDATGNIGWTIAGQIPLKRAGAATVPMDWSEAEGWIGWADAADYPRVSNPGNHRIWSANARVVDGEALAMIGDGGYDLGARAGQIRDGLFAKDRFAPLDMLAIQNDDRALFLERWRKLLLATLSEQRIAEEPGLAEYRRLVDAWIPRAAVESVGYRLVRAFRLEVQSRVFHGLTAPVRQAYGGKLELLISNQFEAALWQLLSERPAHLLPGSYDSWDELLSDSVRANIEWYGQRYGGRLADRRWGERNTAQIRHPLSRAMPLLSGWLDMPGDALDGDVDLPLAQGPAFGASQRFSVSPGDEANGLMQMPTGQSGHPLSDFYRRGHDDWVHGRPSPFLPGEVTYRLSLVPVL